MKTLKESLVIVLSLSFIFVIQNTPLSDYTAPILGIVIALSTVYMLIKSKKKKNDELFIGSYKEVAAIIICLVLAVFLTGSVQSNLFFLLYFLLFGIAFLFEPFTVFVFVAGLLTVFLQEILINDVFSNVIKMGSIVLLSPIAFFFGKEFKRREAEKQEIEEKTNIIIEDAETLKNSAKNEDIEEIDEIIESAEELKKEK